MTKEEAIYKILTESDLAQKVKTMIYPLVAPYGVNRFPYIVYSQMSRYAQGTKDDENRMLILAISAVSKTYKEAHDIAFLAQKILYSDHTTEIENTVGFSNFRFESESEAYDREHDSFMVKLEVSYEYNPVDLWQTVQSE